MYVGIVSTIITNHTNYCRVWKLLFTFTKHPSLGRYESTIPPHGRYSNLFFSRTFERMLNHNQSTCAHVSQFLFTNASEMIRPPLINDTHNQKSCESFVNGCGEKTERTAKNLSMYLQSSLLQSAYI